MALPPLASSADLIARLPSDVMGADETRAAAALDDASALVRDEAGATWVDDDDELLNVPPIVAAITLEVARRALNRSFVYGAEADSDAGLYLKADEKRRLNAAPGAQGGGPGGGLFTIDTTRGDTADIEYRPDNQGGTPIAWGYQGVAPWGDLDP